MPGSTRIVRKYHIEAMSNGYSLKILDEDGETPGTGNTIAHYVAGGMRADTKPETLRKKIVGYALAELKEQLEQALDAADSARPELPLEA